MSTTDSESTKHLDDSTLAAFVESKLTGDERELAFAHLVTCPDCREALAEAVCTMFPEDDGA